MSVSGVSSSSSMYQTDQTYRANAFQQIRQGFKQLATALQSGDLSGAQQAYTALQQLLPNSSGNLQTQNAQNSGGQNSFAADFAALGQALQSGDTSAAQTAFQKLQQDMQAVGHRHHHHHRHGTESVNAQSTPSTTSNSGDGSASGTGGGINIVA